jgi:5'-nucleotidase
MNILLVNDDGIEAVGLSILVDVMKTYGRLHVVAPHNQQSAIGHGITIHQGMRLHRRDDLFSGQGLDAWSLEAKPADCVKFALFGLNLPIDLVVTGINDGPNLGTDIIYSGTLAGASEGIICGRPAIAVSTDFGHFDVARRELATLMQSVLAADILSTENVININFPKRRFASSLGIRVCDMGQRPFIHEYVEIDSAYWANGNWGSFDNPVGSDVWAYENGYISITPIQINRTNYAYMDRIRDRLPGAV